MDIFNQRGSLWAGLSRGLCGPRQAVQQQAAVLACGAYGGPRGRAGAGAWPVPPGHRLRQLERKCYIANPLTLQVGASHFIWTRYVFCKNKTREGLTPELRTLSLHTGSCTLGSHLSVTWTRLHKWAQGPLVLVTGGLQERGSPILEGLRISPNLVPLQEKQEGVSQQERPCHPQQLLREPGTLPPRSSFQLLG